MPSEHTPRGPAHPAPLAAPPPCGETRRELLWQAGGGFAGTALAWMLAQDGFLRSAAAAEGEPLAPQPPHYPARAKSCIFLFMYGGPSQVDLWDPKPELARRAGQPIPDSETDPLLKVRNPGPLLAAVRPFKPRGKSGIEVSDFFPRLGDQVDRLAVIRSMYAESFAHGSGLLQMNTGFLRQGYPCLGSWVTYGLGTLNQNLPGFVVLLDHRGGPIGGPPNWSSGFMPATYQGTQFRTSGDPIIDLNPPQETTTQVRRRELALLGTVNERLGRRHADASELAARIASYELAFRMQASAPEAVDLGQESRATLARYGLDDPATEKFGRRCLLARRLVERGVRFVQVYSGGGHSDETWDAHGDVAKNHGDHCRATDGPIAALLEDLAERGLLDETLVAWSGEFGRTPSAQNGKGRDHNPRGFSAWLAGAGVRGGTVYGATDPFGYRAVENPVHVHDLHATILHLMGLNHERLTFPNGGRLMRLTDVSGRVIDPILA